MRFPNWPERLAEFLEARAGTPFHYGNGGHDCCSFAAAAVEALTGTNPASAWHYANEIGAYRLIKEAGSLEALITQAMGEPVHAAQAGRGDVVLAELENGPTIGVCLGRDCAFPAPVGLTYRPRAVIVKAWKT